MKESKIIKLWKQFIDDNKQYFLSNEEEWIDKLNKCKQYFDINKKRPSKKSKNNDTKKLGLWISTKL